jgi:hypothetical protein
MFGYVRPFKAEMLVKEYEEYKSVYCSLCKKIGKDYGKVMRTILSYDVTFLNLVFLSVNAQKYLPCLGRCTCNPLKRCVYDNADETKQNIYAISAALTIILTYYKIDDNINDESFFKGFKSRLIKLMLLFPMRKAKKNYPEYNSIVSEMMEEQKSVEDKANPNIDECCEPTAKATGKIMMKAVEDNATQQLILQQIGYFLGRWMYLMDASDDIKSDIHYKRFNPFKNKYSLNSDDDLNDNVLKQLHLYCNEELNACVSRIISAYNLLEPGDYSPIISNVLIKGLARMQQQYLFEDKIKRENMRLT